MQNLLFDKYLRLHSLAERVSSVSEFMEEIEQLGSRYFVDGWVVKDYGKFYERVKGGRIYDGIKSQD
jgi:hypothetical protein